jgi:hypothetical protein
MHAISEDISGKEVLVVLSTVAKFFKKQTKNKSTVGVGMSLQQFSQSLHLAEHKV